MATTCTELPDGKPLSDHSAEGCSYAEKPMKRWTSRELFAGQRELVIEHANSEYRLRLTSQGKLVLTK
jgi:hemin uptake protein HemP